jgi:putative salt-induced outer membrane protein
MRRFHPCRTLGAGLALAGLLVGPMASAGPFYAPPPPEEDAKRFSGETELGYTQLSGNTDSQTLIGKGRLTWLTGDWTHTLRGEVRNIARDGETRAEQYRLSGRERYELDGPHYLFGFARWEKDRFSGYDWQATTIGGYGRDILEGDRHRLSLEGGPGYRHDRVEDREDGRLGVAYGAMVYEWRFSEIARLEQELSVEGTDDNTTSRSLSALTAKLNSRLALKVSHEIRDNSNPPEEAVANTDHTTSASLVYDW